MYYGNGTLKLTVFYSYDALITAQLKNSFILEQKRWNPIYLSELFKMQTTNDLGGRNILTLCCFNFPLCGSDCKRPTLNWQYIMNHHLLAMQFLIAELSLTLTHSWFMSSPILCFFLNARTSHFQFYFVCSVSFTNGFVWMHTYLLMLSSSITTPVLIRTAITTWKGL